MAENWKTANNKAAISAQRQLWEDSFAEIPDMFGRDPSFAAVYTSDFIKNRENAALLELGAGQGRDSIFFAKQGFIVTALDYAGSGLACIDKQAKEQEFGSRLTTVQHDLACPLPFADKSFEICFSHMLFCMAMGASEQDSLRNEIHRVLKPGGYLIYSARNVNDPHFCKGAPHGENMYEVDGFIVNFMDQARINDLAKGFKILDIREFEEGELPRRLSLVKMRKSGG